MVESRKAFRITVFVPQEALEDFISSIQDKIPRFDAPYDRVMWWSKPNIQSGTGQFRPLEGADPANGEIGETKRVSTARLEFICPYEKENIEKLISDFFKPAHPYNDPVIYYEEIIWPEKSPPR